MRTRLVLAIVVLAAVGTAAAQSTQALADLAYSKLQTVMQGSPARTTRATKAARRTTFSQGEMNAYLQHRAGTWLPAGITSPSLQFLGASRVTTLVTADLDGVRRKSSGGWFDPTSYLSGKLPVAVTGTLSTGDGRGRFALERATVDGIPVPKLFVDELLAYYTRTPDDPDGIRLEEPFDLPSEITRIDVAQGEAVVIQ